jgi:hypothetical protein
MTAVNWYRVARRRWPRAAWITGDGPFALVAYCPPTTVTLWTTMEAAQAKRDSLDGWRCGHTCSGRHFVEVLRPTGRVA